MAKKRHQNVKFIDKERAHRKNEEPEDRDVWAPREGPIENQS